MVTKSIHTHLLLLLLTFCVSKAQAQCNWTQLSIESYEYTTTVPYLIPGMVYHDSPQTTALANCVRTGTRGLYMNIVDGQSGLLYSQPFTGLCVGQSYRFGFSMRNATNSTVAPNITLNVRNASNVVISTMTSIGTNVWQDLTMPAFTAGSTNVTFEIISNIPGGPGNDVGFDDLRFSQCQPVPQNVNLSLCAGSASQDLYPRITTPVLSGSGIWTGPSALQNGYLGTFNPASNGAGSYTYTIDGLPGCADSVAVIAVQLISTPQLAAVNNVAACGTYTLPAIAGTNLSGNERYYTGANGTGTVLAVGSAVTTTQTIYIYGGAPGCSDQKSFTVTISTAVNAGNDNGANYCGPGPVVNMNNFRSANAGLNGVWAETTTPPSGAFNPATGIFTTAGVTPGTYTFTYTVPANGACPADQAVFTVGIGGTAPVNLGPDTVLCPGQTLTLNAAASGPYSSYLWNNNSTGTTRLVTSAGTYSVKVGILGANQIVNGDFESGNTGFTTAYVPGSTSPSQYGIIGNPGTYAITTSPNLVHQDFIVCQDHTPAPGTNMLAVNGAAVANTNIWCQTVPLQQNTDYQFGTWVTSMKNVSVSDLAQLQFSINGSPFGTVYSPSTTGCNWGQFTQNWNSGMNTSAQICVVSQNIASQGGNDFAIDDITFRPICFSYDTVVVTYGQFPVVNLGADIFRCEGANVVLDAQNPGSTYLWTGGTTAQTLAVTTSGTYQVTVKNPQHCSATDQINVTFEQQKNAGRDTVSTWCITNATANLNTLLASNATPGGTWFDLANTMNGGLNANGMLNYSLISGAHQATYVVSGTYCPNDSARVNFVVNDQPNAGPDGSSHVCNTAGDDIDVNTLIIPVHTVLPGFWRENSATPSNQFTPATGVLNLSGLAQGDYIFEYILPASQPCLSDTARVKIKVTENPQVQFSADKIRGCIPVEVTFTNESNAQGNLAYSWDLGDGGVSTAPLSFAHVYESANCFDVNLTITADNLCSSTLTMADMICGDPNPIASFHYSPQQVFSDGPLVQFNNTSQMNDFNEWTFDDGESSTLANPQHQYPLGEVGNYLARLIVRTTAGCTDTAYQAIIVKDQLIFYVPNTFTPDGDEFNNIFRPVMTAGFDASDYTLKIYNRWGELIFVSKDIYIGWDGTYNGEILKDGTYTWTLEFGHNDTDERFVRNGHVNLLR